MDPMVRVLFMIGKSQSVGSNLMAIIGQKASELKN